MGRVIGQRWEIYDYAKVKDEVIKKGEKVVVKGTPDFEEFAVELISNAKDRTIESLYNDYKAGKGTPFRIADEQDNASAEVLASAKDYADQVAKNEWLPPVNTAAQLKKTGLSNKKNYLCKVIADPDKTKCGVHQAVSGWTTTPQWALFDATVDLVNETELATAVSNHNTSASAHSISLAATTNTDTSTDTGLLSGAIASVLQTVWNKIRSVVNALSATNTAVSAKQDKITATGADKLLTAPSSQGGQPGSKLISDFILETQKGAANGVANLDSGGKIPSGLLPGGGQGLMAVATDTSLTGDGTSASPLGVEFNSLTADKITVAVPAEAGSTVLPVQSPVSLLAWLKNIRSNVSNLFSQISANKPIILDRNNPMEIGVSELETGKLAFYYGADLPIPRSQLFIGVNNKAQAAAPASNALDTIMDIFRFHVKAYPNKSSIFNNCRIGDRVTVHQALQPRIFSNDMGAPPSINVGDLIIMGNGTSLFVNQEVSESEYVFGESPNTFRTRALAGKWILVSTGFLASIYACNPNIFVNITVRRIE